MQKYLFINENNDFGVVWDMEQCVESGTPIDPESDEDMILVGPIVHEFETLSGTIYVAFAGDTQYQMLNGNVSVSSPLMEDNFL